MIDGSLRTQLLNICNGDKNLPDLEAIELEFNTQYPEVAASLKKLTDLLCNKKDTNRRSSLEIPEHLLCKDNFFVNYRKFYTNCISLQKNLNKMRNKPEEADLILEELAVIINFVIEFSKNDNPNLSSAGVEYGNFGGQGAFGSTTRHSYPARMS